jgi:hypothetical protein
VFYETQLRTELTQTSNTLKILEVKPGEELPHVTQRVRTVTQCQGSVTGGLSYILSTNLRIRHYESLK